MTAAFNEQDAAGGIGQGLGGAAEAVGVLTAVDEDGEGAEEAPLPAEFEYFSDEPQDEDLE